MTRDAGAGSRVGITAGGRYQPPPSAPSLDGYYAATTGSAGGSGNIDSPWDIDTVLAKGVTLAGTRLTSIPDGQGGTKQVTRIFLRAGTYGSEGVLKTPTLQGTATNPVVLCAYPGETVHLDMRFDLTGTPNLWFQRLRQYNSDANTANDRMGHNVRSDGMRFLHCLADHNLGNGWGLWAQATNLEMYGCFAMRNGRFNDAARAHGMYIQGTGKKFRNCVLHHNLGSDIHGYGSQTLGAEWDDLVLIACGSVGLSSVVWKQDTINDVTIRRPRIYAPGQAVGTFGPDQGTAAGVISITDLVGRFQTLNVRRWTGKTLTGWETTGLTLMDIVNNNAAFTIDTWACFRATGSVSDYFGLNNTPYTLAGIRAATTFHDNTTETVSAGGIPTSNRIVVLPSIYEPLGAVYAASGIIVVFNWTSAAAVDLDPSAILNSGETWALVHAFDPWGTPLQTGTYNGSPISLNMAALDSLTVATPGTGWPAGRTPLTPGRIFGVFELRRT